jgi:hypothetical protein
VPSITGDSAIDLAIGLGFVFFLMSIVCSSLNEAIAAVLNLRARTLEAGIRNLFESEQAAKSFYQHWRIQSLFSNTIVSWIRGHEKKPSYIPASTFALTMLDTFAPPTKDANGTLQPSSDLIGRARTALAKAEEATDPSHEAWIGSKVQGILQDAINAVDEASSDRDAFRQEIEVTFDNVMDRVSGWYKRRSQLIVFILALALASGLNVDTFTIGQQLWKNDTLRAAVVTQATATATSTTATCANNPTSPADTAAQCIGKIAQLELPIGWTKATSPKNASEDATKAIGLILTAIAVLLGAPFWFDFLGKAAQLRSTGSKPARPDPTTAAAG